MTSDSHRPVVLLTGASAGLGLVIAEKLIDKDDYRLILTARESSLHRFADAGIHEGDHVSLRPLDVTAADQREAIVEEAENQWDGIDILVNNAGVSYRSVVEHVVEDDRLTQMDVNFRSPMELARLVLPAMRKQGEGRIINISSVGGMMAMPTMAVYSASKFALEGATEALWYEVRPWNIDVSLVEPGFINSESFQKTRMTDRSEAASGDARAAYATHYEKMSAFIEKMMNRALATPETVADKVVHTMERSNPPLRVPATIDARLFSWMRRLFPRRLYHWILYRTLPDIDEWGPDSTKKLESERSQPTTNRDNGGDDRPADSQPQDDKVERPVPAEATTSRE